MDSYVGLDVSLREVSVCVVDEAGAIQSERTVAADPDVIAALLHAQAPTVRRVGLESGPTSVWLWRELAERGLPVICIDARHAKAALSMLKTDPLLDPLRKEPRFQAIERELKFPPQ